MILKDTKWRLALLSVAALAFLTTTTVLVAAGKSDSWSLISPNEECQITVTLSDDGQLSYDALRDEKLSSKITARIALQ